MAKDKYTWSKSVDPDGRSHWVREKKESKGVRFSKGFNKAVGATKSFAPFLLLIVLFRWFMVTEWGYHDEGFVSYPDGSGLVYFDFFTFLKSFAAGVGNISNAFKSFVDGGNWSNWSFDWPDIIWNVIAFALNLVMFVGKLVFAVPLSLICLLLGGFANSWTVPGGWLHEFMWFEVPYWDSAAMWEFIGKWIYETSMAIGEQIAAWWDSIWDAVQAFFLKLIPWLNKV